MESSLLTELKEARGEMDGLILRLNWLDSYKKELTNELKSLNLTEKQLEQLVNILFGEMK